MASDPHVLERLLTSDLDQVFADLADGEGSTELYRALTNNRWGKPDGPDGWVSLSWTRAEEIVNELRERVGKPPLALAQSGGEGTVSERIEETMRQLGWTHQPLDTGHHDDAHVAQEQEAPPQGRKAAEGRAAHEPPRWEREAHAEADRNATRRDATPIETRGPIGTRGGTGAG
jgi:hypothetical protein